MKRKRHPPEEIIKKLVRRRRFWPAARALKKSARSWKSVHTDLPSMAAGVWRGEGENGKAAQSAGEGKHPVQETGGRPVAGQGDAQGARGGKVVGPARKREAVAHLEGTLEVSQRRACEVIVQPRSTQRYRGRQRSKDAALAAELRRISAQHPRAGYRMATALLRRAGMEINAKRVQRLWRQEGLKVPRRQRKRRRLGSSDQGTQYQRATRVNEVWSYDFVFDQTEDGRRLKWLPICDEFSRESVALEVERRMESGDVIRILDAAVRERGEAPDFIRSDNGPEFVALAVQDWIARRGFKTLCIKPGSPWQNAYSESFNSRFRDEFLNRESFASVLEAKVLGKQYRHDYNHARPHSSLD